jgi:hypothetical protein
MAVRLDAGAPDVTEVLDPLMASPPRPIVDQPDVEEAIVGGDVPP